jgi:uncharacterized membrane protein HdeD (DUF308 family)
MTTAAQPAQQIQPVQQFWWLALLQGIAAVIVGAMLVIEPADTFLALIPLIGIYWLVIGILSLVRIFIDRSVPWIWSLLSGIIGVLAGLAVLRHPLTAAILIPTVLVIVLGVQGLVMGICELIEGFRGGGAWSFILGIINILVGVLLLARPVAIALAVPLVFGILLLVQGVALIIWAFRARPA